MLNNSSFDLFSLGLCHFDFLSLKEKQIVKKKLDNLKALALLSMQELSILVGRTFSAKAQIPKNLEKRVEKDLFLMNSYSIGVIFYFDKDYPALLKEIYDPPFALFYRGNKDVLSSECFGVVGTRRPTGKGMESAYMLGKQLGEYNFTVVSGLARGIDTYAHKGALSGIADTSKGSTIAVLASGLDSIYPSENRHLASAIIQNNGCLVSEYVPSEPSLTWHFPQRNRIISGLSEAIVVIEAPAGSGALITADFALEHNRELFFHGVALEYKFTKPLVSSKKKSVLEYVEDGAGVIHSAEEMIDKMQNPCAEGNMGAGLHFTQLQLDLN